MQIYWFRLVVITSSLVWCLAVWSLTALSALRLAADQVGH
jgi:hypothetical protein